MMRRFYSNPAVAVLAASQFARLASSKSKSENGGKSSSKMSAAQSAKAENRRAAMSALGKEDNAAGTGNGNQKSNTSKDSFSGSKSSSQGGMGEKMGQSSRSNVDSTGNIRGEDAGRWHSGGGGAGTKANEMSGNANSKRTLQANPESPSMADETIRGIQGDRHHQTRYSVDDPIPHRAPGAEETPIISKLVSMVSGGSPSSAQEMEKEGKMGERDAERIIIMGEEGSEGREVGQRNIGRKEAEAAFAKASKDDQKWSMGYNPESSSRAESRKESQAKQTVSHYGGNGSESFESVDGAGVVRDSKGRVKGTVTGTEENSTKGEGVDVNPKQQQGSFRLHATDTFGGSQGGAQQGFGGGSASSSMQGSTQGKKDTSSEKHDESIIGKGARLVKEAFQAAEETVERAPLVGKAYKAEQAHTSDTPPGVVSAPQGAEPYAAEQHGFDQSQDSPQFERLVRGQSSHSKFESQAKSQEFGTPRGQKDESIIGKGARLVKEAFQAAEETIERAPLVGKAYKAEQAHTSDTPPGVVSAPHGSEPYVAEQHGFDQSPESPQYQRLVNGQSSHSKFESQSQSSSQQSQSSSQSQSSKSPKFYSSAQRSSTAGTASVKSAISSMFSGSSSNKGNASKHTQPEAIAHEFYNNPAARATPFNIRGQVESEGQFATASQIHSPSAKLPFPSSGYASPFDRDPSLPSHSQGFGGRSVAGGGASVYEKTSKTDGNVNITNDETLHLDANPFVGNPSPSSGDSGSQQGSGHIDYGSASYLVRKS